MVNCPVCGGSTFIDRPILWDALVVAWELSPEERAYVDRQQGTCCSRCGANLRSGALAEALLGAAGGAGTLLEFVDTSAAAHLEVLEINQAGFLSPVLARLPHHRLAGYPDLDMQAMPYPDESFDLVVHSDTLEHVRDPFRALSECRRVLRPTGALCFTVPIIVGRLTRSCAGRPPSFHGTPAAESEDLRVQTEFGADIWTWPLRAGFAAVTVTTIEYPAALAVTGWRDRPRPIGQSLGGEIDPVRGNAPAMQASHSWSGSAGFRRLSAFFRR
jgi:SAM-dependent methyltransferase